jgi:hypothetical protein
MTEEAEMETTPIPPTGKVVQTLWFGRLVVKNLSSIFAALALLVTAWAGFRGTSKQEVKEEAKDAAEVARAVVKKPVDELQKERDLVRKRLTDLEAEMVKLKATARNAHLSAAKKRRAEEIAAAVAAEMKREAPAPPKLTPVPDSLDKAVKAQEAAK